jgi:hypothetical protein
MGEVRRKGSRLLALGMAVIVSLSLAVPAKAAFGEETKAVTTMTATNALDRIYFGNTLSEQEHLFEEKLSVAGVDDRTEPEYRGADGMLTGGGLGHGLTYRYIKPSPDASLAFDGKLEFTLKADSTRQNYLTIRVSGTQQGRGNLMLYGPNGDKTILNSYYGTKFSELDNGYQEGAPFLGRYYYNTYVIPQGLVHPDGTVRLTVMSTGKFAAYGSSTYGHQQENSRFIYSAATHTDPFYMPEDSFTGEIPAGAPAVPDGNEAPYDTLQAQGLELLELIMSWQLYGPSYEAFKSTSNSFLEGATVTYTPVSELAKFNGTTREAWAKKVTAQAINHQNWSPFMATEIFANAFMNGWSGKYYRNEELLDRIIKLYDFFSRAQDSQGAWCVPTTGENAYKWIGANLNGTGQRGKGENWPLLSLGTDSHVQTLLQLHNYIVNGENQELRERYTAYLDEMVDNGLTGQLTQTRRASYIEMFAKLRNYMFTPAKGDFYDPAARAGTANQDFGFAYDANRAVQLLFDSMNWSDANKPSDIADAFQVKDSAPYLHQLKYKFGEMVDGQKWFSDQGVGLEGGASHGGWAGEYGLLLLKNINKYAETAEGSSDLEEFLGELSYRSYETGKYFFRPSVTADGVNVLISEMYGGSRNAANGQKIAYQVGGFTAVKRGSEGALRILLKYLEDNRAYGETFKEEIYTERTPHVYTRILELQELLKHYKEAEVMKRELEQKGEMVYLPMEDGHPDFAWADPGSQAVVFKNKGDKAYITFNYRRSDWEYNNNVRIHFTTDDVDRLANVVGTSKGGSYTFLDTVTHPNGKAYTHTRTDGYSQVRYGKYFIGMNQSKDDAAVGQTGKVYEMDTLGIKRAKDLISGKVYESVNGRDIRIQVQPRQTVVLEVLEETPANQVSVKYVAGSKILKVENIPAVVGNGLTVTAKDVDGYKRINESAVTLTVSPDNSRNIVTFQYADNSAPVFHRNGVPGTEADYALANLGNSAGDAVWDEDGSPAALTNSSTGHFSPTFAYKEVTGDVELTVRLEKFQSTATDKDYFSLLLTDSKDLRNGSYVQLRHFPNNNNILLVSHKEGQPDTITGYWAGDMNNKKVPIYFKLIKEGGTVTYYFSLDEGKTYQQTSKPVITFPTADKLYVGAAMTSTTGAGNTAYFSKLEIKSDDEVLAPFKTGKEIRIDLGADDPDGDEVHYQLFGMPEGAQFDEDSKLITWTPDTKGSYTIKAEASDDYHQSPVWKTKEIVIGNTPEDAGLLKSGLDSIRPVGNLMVTEGERIFFETSAPRANVQMEGNYPDVAQVENGSFVWDTKRGDTGVYQAVITYGFDSFTVRKVVQLTVVKAEEGIDYSVDREVLFGNLGPQRAEAGREFVFDLETIVPLDGFGLNVSASGLPEGAVFANRTLRWTPASSYANKIQSLIFTATQPNGKTSTGVLNIHVIPGTVLNPSSITLDQTVLHLRVSEEAKLQAVVLPEEAQDKTVLWSSGDERIASVDQTGRVSAIAAGETVVTAATRTGGLTVSAAVYVSDAGAPGLPVLQSNSGYSNGLLTGDYTVTMNMWWGINGSIYKLYENGVLLDTIALTSNTPSAQQAVTQISGRKNGNYKYVGELINSRGSTRSAPLTVHVTQAPPSAAVLSHDNWDGDGAYKVIMNMWWGTNATAYRLYENGQLIDSQPLASRTPDAQTAETAISGKAPGVYEYTAELENGSGITRSSALIVTVTK